MFAMKTSPKGLVLGAKTDFEYIDKDFAIHLVRPKFLNLLMTDKICMGMAERGSFKKYSEAVHIPFLKGCVRERSGSVVECLTRDRRAAGSSLTGVTALWSLSKTHLS